MSTTLLGFDVSHVPTADVMELAAKLLEYDAGTIARLVELAGGKAPGRDHNESVAALLRERAAEVRALELLAQKRELDS